MTAGAHRDRPFLIAVLGAPGTGKTTLVGQLRSALADLPRLRITDGGEPGVEHETLAADLVLLMALDLPCPVELAPVQSRADAALRSAFAGSGTGWSVITGMGDDRHAHALAAVRRALATREAVAPTRWQWRCEHCDDPACERRLLPRTAP